MLQVVKQTDQGGIPSAVTRAVVDELVARRIEQYPADIVELAKQCVTDFLAVTLAGTRETGSQAVAAEIAGRARQRRSVDADRTGAARLRARRGIDQRHGGARARL